MDKVLDQAKQSIEVPAELPAPPVEPSGGFPWGGVGIGILAVAVIAIATKVLSD